MKLKRRHWWLGAPSVIMSAVVGASVFSELQESVDDVDLRYVLASVSVAAAVLAGLVTFFDFAGRSSSHKVASEGYSLVAKVLQTKAVSLNRMPPHEWLNVLDGYAKRLEAIGVSFDIPIPRRRRKTVLFDYKSSFGFEKGFRSHPSGTLVDLLLRPVFDGTRKVLNFLLDWIGKQLRPRWLQNPRTKFSSELKAVYAGVVDAMRESPSSETKDTQ